MNSLIKQYINKLTINNINDFAVKNNIILNEKELNILYEITKNHYEELLKGNDTKIANYLKENLTEENYIKVTNLYDEYKTKYQGYL